MPGNGPIRIVRMVYIDWRICKPSESLKQNVFHCSGFLCTILNRYYWKNIINVPRLRGIYNRLTANPNRLSNFLLPTGEV